MVKRRKGVIAVVVADDHAMLRAGFISSLADYPDIEVVGQTADISEVPELYRRTKPDVLVLDIMFGGKKTGLDVLKEVIESDPAAKVVILTQFDQDSLVREAYKCGAMAFCSKNVDIEQLVTAIRRASSGQRYFLPTIAERLADLATRTENTPIDRLTDREREVLKLISRGRTALEASQALGVSLRTIVSITKSIKTKFSVKKQRDLIGLAQKYYPDPWPPTP